MRRFQLFSILFFCAVSIASGKDDGDYRHRGASFEENGQYAEAVKVYTEAIEKNASDTTAYLCRAEAHRKDHEYDKALEDVNRALKDDPSSSAALVKRAEIYNFAEKFELALQDASKARELDPKNVDAVVAELFSLLKLGRRGPREIFSEIEMIVKNSNSENAKAYYLQGLILSEYPKSHKQALTLLSKAISVDPSFAPAYTERGAVYHKLWKIKEEIKDFDRAIKLDPKCALAYYRRAEVIKITYLGKKAINDYCKCVELAPDNQKYLLARADFYGGSLFLPELAMADYQKAEKLGPLDMMAQEHFINACIQSGCFEQAVKKSQEMVKILPQWGRFDVHLANSYAGLGDFERALVHITKTVERYDDQPCWFIDRAKIYSALEGYTEALKDLDTALSLEPGYPVAYYEYGNLYFIKGDYREALKAYEIAPKLLCGDDAVLNAYVCRLKLGEDGTKELKGYFAKKRLVKEWPRPVSKMMLGEISFAECVKSTETSSAFTNRRYRNQALFHYGELLLQKGEKEKAKECFEEILKDLTCPTYLCQSEC